MPVTNEIVSRTFRNFEYNVGNVCHTSIKNLKFFKKF